MNVLVALSLAMTGILAGIYVSAWIHDDRINDLSAVEYTAMHQMRDKTFRRIMPPLALSNVAILLLNTAFGLSPGVPRILGGVACGLFVVDTLLTIELQLPLNQQIQSWKADSIPSNWAEIRDRWARHHNVRTVLAVAANASVIAATVWPGSGQ
jgi:hypothetical protein